MTSLQQILIDAVVSFIYWTGTLTPYMVFVVQTSFEQYLSWVVMQALIVPPLGVGFAWIARKLTKMEFPK